MFAKPCKINININKILYTLYSVVTSKKCLHKLHIFILFVLCVFAIS